MCCGVDSFFLTVVRYNATAIVQVRMAKSDREREEHKFAHTCRGPVCSRPVSAKALCCADGRHGRHRGACPTMELAYNSSFLSADPSSLSSFFLSAGIPSRN